MGRTRVACLLLIALAAVIVIAGGATIGLRPQSPESLEQLVYMPQTPVRVRLGSGALDPQTGKHLTPQELVVEIASPHTNYITNWDGSSEDQVLVPNSGELVSSQSYYAPQPGEVLRRPHVTRKFGPGSNLLSERVVTVAGVLAQTLTVFPDGGKQIIGFGRDGKTHVQEQVFSKPECCDGAILLRDEKWRDDANHTLAYRDVYNQDETRTITDFDEQQRILKIVQWSKNHSTYGTTVKAFYPGSLKLRLESTTDYYHDEVRYYRESGTLEALVEISSSSFEVHYYDESGTRERLYQQYFIGGSYSNVTAADGQYKLYVATEFDGVGNKTRSYTFDDGVVRDAEYYNVTVDGTTYFRLDFEYKDGVLTTKRYWLHEVKFPPFKVEEHAPAEHLTPEPLDPASMRLQVQIEAGLPRPYPQGAH